ncbi:DedA family protein [Williamsia sp. CHRR-6]|uniref:DedA family protein n=1 Tax=Williamsia sp. CHRR-6 TaxID=2835871 RepID=UPI001BDA4196|nr:DedA family protein [Williamsia sp. CHRR-6]MBT0566813.1 DedA family protein [Williamsia sp. CHRR-6]
MIEAIVDWLLDLPPWLALTMAFLFPALEASVFIGVVIPGEIAVLIAGVIANGGRLSLWEVLIAAIAGAVIGDFIGFEVGKRWGTQLLAKIPPSILKPAHVEQAREALRKRGALAVLFGRWVAALRALIPGMAGMAAIPTRTFVIANAIGGTIWATVVASLGYAAGKSYKVVERDLGWVSYAAIGVLVVVVMVIVGRRVYRNRKHTVVDVESTPT